MKSLLLTSLVAITTFLCSCANMPTRLGPKVLKIGQQTTLVGQIKQIKTYDQNGNTVYPYYLFTKRLIAVSPSGAYNPGDTNKILDGMEIKLINGDQRILSQYDGRELQIDGTVAPGQGLYCLKYGFYVESIANIRWNQ